MDLESLNSVLCFTQDENELLYKNIDGFLYTLQKKNDQAIVYVNLPEVSKNEKKMISAYLSESALHYVKSRFLKNGIQINFNIAFFEDAEYVIQFAKQFSLYLLTAGMEFSNSELDVAFDGFLYAFLPIEKPITIQEEEKTHLSLKERIKKLREGLSTQLILIIIYGILALLYAIISVFAINIAGAVGYIIGWLPATVLIKRKYSHKTVYLVTTIVSLIVLALTTAYVFLYYFLSQQDIYSASEFIMQSLTPSHCLFNMALAFVLALFGTYSTVPAKKKKPANEDDFS